MKTLERVFNQLVENAIKRFADKSTGYLESQLTLIKKNLETLAGAPKIVSLPEHRKVKMAHAILTEVVRDRRKEVRPNEPIDPTKPRAGRGRRSTGALKIIS